MSHLTLCEKYDGTLNPIILSLKSALNAITHSHFSPSGEPVTPSLGRHPQVANMLLKYER